MAEDLDEEPYRAICAGLTMALITQLIGDPQAAAAVVPHIPHINDVVKRFFLSMTAKEAYEEGQTRRILIGIVSSAKDLAENTQLRARDWFVPMEIAPGKTIEFPGVPYRLSGTPLSIGRPPRLGEHTAEVLAGLG
jgi:crotonobetainyl-CoA:carnitine CoA-transferase CaiB-like acyl-CoA transferase